MFSEFLQGFPHSYNIFRRDLGLDIMDSVENIAAAGHQGSKIFSDIFPYLLRVATTIKQKP